MERRRTHLLSPLLYVGVLLGVLLAAALSSRPAEEPTQALVPQASYPMQLPADYRERFVHYLTVDRVDNTTRHIYIQPEAIADLDADEPLPDGTQIIIEAYHAQLDVLGRPVRDAQGHFLPGAMFPNVHMAEKRSTWTVDELATSIGVVEWNFGSFDAQTTFPTVENRNDCFTCHDLAHRRDFVFTRTLLDRYLQSGERQHFFCNRPERGICSL